MTKLLLIRHGETYDNVAQIMQGQTQGELNDRGILQAKTLRDRMRDERIDVFVASDLRRSYDTCRLIAEPHGKPVVQTALLRERDWGDFTGRFIPDLQGIPFPDNVETIAQITQRANEFMEWLNQHYAHRVILAVGHGIINKAIQSVFFHVPMNAIQRMENAEVRTLTW